jgi:F-type H+-transporting ATPase subunit epsilon
MATLTVEVLAPEAVLWRGPAAALIARSSEGDFTIMPQHTAVVGDIVSTIVRVEAPEGEVAFAVHAGYFQVGPGAEEGETLATVLASVAERTTEIDVARAQAALDLAEAVIASAGKGDQHPGADYYLALQAKERAELRLLAAARR